MSKAWAMAALGGILAGLSGCGGEAAPPVVPGAPEVDPAGVPAVGGAKAQSSAKHACATDGSCGGMNEPKKGDGKAAPTPTAAPHAP